MSIIFYNSINTKESKRLQKILEANVSGKKIETYKNIEVLIKRLNQIDPGSLVIAVLLIGSLKEMYQAGSINQSIGETRIMLILPERSTAMTSSGFMIYPRFIGYIDNDFNDIAMVLRKMQQNIQGKEHRYE